MAKAGKRKIENVEEVKPQFATTLSSGDLLICETLSRDVELARLACAVEEQNLRNLALELKNMEYRYIQQKTLVSTKAQEYENSKKKYIGNMVELWPKYGLSYSEGIGYDSVTGEIKK